MKFAGLNRHARQAGALLKALGNERRLLVLCHLAEGERSVGALERLIGLSQSALSQHLARLRRDNVVVTRRVAQTVYYSLAHVEAEAVLELLDRLLAGPQQPAEVERLLPNQADV
jgi:DNA-binding transcriptional ArsR family regulator